MRNMHNARNAGIAASSQHALETALSRNLPGRDAIYFPIGTSVQIADLGKWIRAYRVGAHESPNLIARYGRRLLKWHRVKCRVFAKKNDGNPCKVIGPEMMDGDLDRPTRFDADPSQSLMMIAIAKKPRISLISLETLVSRATSIGWERSANAGWSRRLGIRTSRSVQTDY